jgi:glycosyltransferase involved in cell wall biosynthesis
VVVTACDDSPVLRRNLDRIAAQAAPLGAEVVLVVNRSADEFALAPELESRVSRVVFESQPGKSNALNRAVEDCASRVIAFTDDDALPDDGWLREITAPLLAPGSDVCGAGGPVLPVFPAGGPPRWYRQIIARTRSSFLGPFHFLGNEPCDYVIPDGADPLPLGANCAYSLEALRAHPFRVDLGPNYHTRLRGGEDTVFALQCLMSGRRLVYVPGARVHHPVEPERMTLEYVRDGYKAQGKEYVRILRAVGRPLPSERRLRRAIHKHDYGWLRSLLAGPSRKLRRDLKRDFLITLLAETNSA